MDYKLYRMTNRDVDYFWKNMCKEDRQELEIMGSTPATLKKLISDKENVRAFTCKIDGKKIACGGYNLSYAVDKATPNLLVFWFFVIRKHKKYILRATKILKAFIDNICRDQRYYQYKKVVQVWSGHRNALRWVRLLGFQRLIAFMPVGLGETSVYIIRRAKGAPFKELINDKFGYERVSE